MTAELPDYRPVSRLAVAAFVAGIASCLVLFTPLAAMLPLVAIALAVVALAEIRKNEERMAGRWPALGGLALAVGFVAQAFTTTLVDGMVAKRRASATAVSWVTAIREGRFDDALAVSSPGSLMAVAQDGHEAGVDRDSRREAFQAIPLVKAVAGCGKTAPRQTATGRIQEGWGVRFSLEDCGASKEFTISVAPRLVAIRGAAIEEWRVNGFTLEP